MDFGELSREVKVSSNQDKQKGGVFFLHTIGRKAHFLFLSSGVGELKEIVVAESK